MRSHANYLFNSRNALEALRNSSNNVTTSAATTGGEHYRYGDNDEDDANVAASDL